MHTPEWFEKKAVKEYLDGIKAWYFSPYMAGFGKAGVPDIIACINGTMWGLEIKRDDRKPTKLQSMRIAEIRQAGGQATYGPADKVIADIEAWRNLKLEGTTFG